MIPGTSGKPPKKLHTKKAVRETELSDKKCLNSQVKFEPTTSFDLNDLYSPKSEFRKKCHRTP